MQVQLAKANPRQQAFRLRQPTVEDGRAVHELIAACPPLDTNSLYCNLLQCTHFAGTCVLSESVGNAETPAGFVSAYLPPDKPGTLFVWQVAVAAQARGAGLGRRMILELLSRPACVDVHTIETTITPSNKASWAMFQGVAKALQASWSSTPLFDGERHMGGSHESEMLMIIGPFSTRHSPTQSDKEH